MREHVRLAVAAAILLSSAGITFGATRTWTGAAGGGDPSWTTPANWTPNGIPATGEDLVLNAGALDTSNNNFGSVLTFNTISLKNHLVVGAAITLNAGLTAEGAQISLGSIKLNNAQTFTAPTAGVAAAITCTIDTNGKTLSFDGPGQLAFLNVISGAGGVIKSGSGIVQFNAANSYTGLTKIDQGTLLVFGSQPASEVRISTLTPGGPGILGGAGTVGPVSCIFGCTIAPGALNNGTGILTINGNVVYPSAQVSSLTVDIKGDNPGTGYDQVQTTGNVFLGGTTFLTVVIDPAFTPTRGSTFTIIKNDGPDPVQGAFNGKPEGGFFTVGGTTFVISYRGGDGNDVVLRVAAVWDGGGSDNNWTTAANWVGDVIPAAGDDLVFPPAAARKGNTNDFPNGTGFDGLHFQLGVYLISGNDITLGTSGVIALPSTNVEILMNITLAGPSIFLEHNPSALDIFGEVNIGPHTLTIDVGSGGLVNFEGALTGTGEIHKIGAATGRLNLFGKDQTSTGAIKVFGGDILVSTPLAAPVFLDAAGTATANDIDFTGTTSIGPLTVGGATVSAGILDNAGLLTVNGDATFAGNPNTLATFVVTLAGATANNQDKLKVQGQVTLTKVLLTVNLKNGFIPGVGSKFVIIANDGTDPVQGVFLGTSEGSMLIAQGVVFSISYKGGDGNDVELTTVSAPPPTAPPTLANISTRLPVLGGDNVLIGGMIATGNTAKKVIIRAIGPTLTDFGLPNALPDPVLELFRGGTLILSNDDWRLSDQQGDIENSGFAPGKEAESAIIVSLVPNQNYTAVVRGKNGQTGVGLVEAFDLDELATTKLANISTRGFVAVDDNVMIAGVIAGPAGAQNNIKVLVRALGPTLGDFGVAGFLVDPTLELVSSNGTVIRSNNDWKTSQQAEIEAAQLAPVHNEEAALVESLAPGAYTAIVRGNGRTTGVGLVEVYNIP